jgi:hypothetical protein
MIEVIYIFYKDKSIRSNIYCLQSYIIYRDKLNIKRSKNENFLKNYKIPVFT